MTDWELLFDYLKFSAGIGIMIFSYLVKVQNYELLLVVGSLIILVSGVEINFGKKSAKKRKSLV